MPDHREAAIPEGDSFLIRLRLWTCLLLLGVFILAGSGCARKQEVAAKVSPPPAKVQPRPERKPQLSKLEQWNRLLARMRYASVWEKIVTVNTFFNRFSFVDDSYLWGRGDYWATPFETLTKDAGDCEDLCIAKYFTLRRLNIDDEQMRLTYVISLKTGKPHMVLTCLLHSAPFPIVLDNTTKKVLPVSERSDLVPVYSFNRNGYWLARKDKSWQGERLGSALKLALWRELLARMTMEGSQYAHR